MFHSDLKTSKILIMTSTRSGRSSPPGSPDVYRTWSSTYQQPSKYAGDIFPCLVHPRRFRISWSTVSVFEIIFLLLVAVIYLSLSERTLLKMLPEDGEKFVNELGLWMLRLFASLIIMQVSFKCMSIYVNNSVVYCLNYSSI